MSLLPYVIGSRVRLARNITHHRFPHAASADEGRVVGEQILQATRQISQFDDAEIIALQDISVLERKILQEKFLISHALASRGESGAVILPASGKASILINEEDHLRIQAFSVGLSVRAAWQRARRIERALAERLEFAASATNGFLTSCPKNSGLGLRASAMLFVPGLQLLQGIVPALRRALDKGCTVRGTYGEGSEAQGALLQISIQIPQAKNADTVFQQLNAECQHIIVQEQRARAQLETSARSRLRRAFKQAERRLVKASQLDVAAGMDILALYRLRIALQGASHGLKTAKYFTKKSCLQELRRIDLLSIRIQPAHIRQYALRQAHHGPSTSSCLHHEHPNAIRAAFLKATLGRASI